MRPLYRGSVCVPCIPACLSQGPPLKLLLGVWHPLPHHSSPFRQAQEWVVYVSVLHLLLFPGEWRVGKEGKGSAAPCMTLADICTLCELTAASAVPSLALCIPARPGASTVSQAEGRKEDLCQQEGREFAHILVRMILPPFLCGAGDEEMHLSGCRHILSACQRTAWKQDAS